MMTFPVRKSLYPAALILLLLFMLCSITSIALADQHNSRVFSLATYDDYLPNSTKAGNETAAEGYFIDLAQRLLQGTDRQINYVWGLAWKRALRSVETGLVDGLFEVSFREERAQYMDFVGVSDVERAYLVVREDNELQSIDTLDDFLSANLKIQINMSIAWDDAFDKRLKEDEQFGQIFSSHDGSISVSDTADFEAVAARLISAGRIEAHLVHQPNINKMIEASHQFVQSNPQAKKLKAVPVPAFGEPVTYFAVSRKTDPDLRRKIRENYSASRKDGSFDAIWRKWHGDTEPAPDLRPE